MRKATEPTRMQCVNNSDCGKHRCRREHVEQCPSERCRDSKWGRLDECICSAGVQVVSRVGLGATSNGEAILFFLLRVSIPNKHKSPSEWRTSAIDLRIGDVFG